MPRVYRLERSQVLAGTIAEIWAFFSDPRNLAQITPPDVEFVLACDPPATVHDGLLLAYRLRPLLGIHAPWVSRIRDVHERHSFVDEQVVGPYAYWRHEHLFTPASAGIRVQDRVRYALPFGVAGRLAHAAVVKRRLDAIFDYRQRALARHFGTARAGLAVLP